MPNPIKYSASAQTQALKKGNYWIGTGDVGKGPTKVTDYWEGITPPSGGYTIYGYKGANGPSIYLANNDSELITLTNKIAGTNYTTVNECLNYYAGQTDKMVVNKDYERIITDGLVLNLDASFIPSYPKNGNTWYDISSGGNNGTLTNGPTFNSSDGGSIVFDGVDDYVNISFNDLTMDFSLGQTICMWIKPTTGSNTARRNPYNQAYGGSGTLTHEPNGTINYYFGTNGGNSTPYVGRNSVFTVVANETAFISVTRDQTTNICNWYKNGVLFVTANAGGYVATANGTSPIWIGSGYAGRFLGNIYDCRVYNRALSETEILQNYNAQKSRFGL